MSQGPGLFSDFGRKATDLLSRDYVFDEKFSVSTPGETGVVLSSTAVKRGGLLTSDIALLYKYNNALINVKLDAETNVIATTLTFTDLVPSMNAIASFKLPDYNSGKLEVQVVRPLSTFTAAVALNQIKTVDFSTTVGTPTRAFGAEGAITSTGELTNCAVGMSLTKPDACASIIWGEDGDTIKASYVRFDSLKRSAAVWEISKRFSSNRNTFTFGGLYAVDDLTTVKAKLNTDRKLGVLLQHEVTPKFMVSVASEINTKALYGAPRFGLALALKP